MAWLIAGKSINDLILLALATSCLWTHTWCFEIVFAQPPLFRDSGKWRRIEQLACEPAFCNEVITRHLDKIVCLIYYCEWPKCVCLPSLYSADFFHVWLFSVKDKVESTFENHCFAFFLCPVGFGSPSSINVPFALSIKLFLLHCYRLSIDTCVGLFNSKYVDAGKRQCNSTRWVVVQTHIWIRTDIEYTIHI